MASTAQQTILDDISDKKYDNEVIAMLVMAHYALGAITLANVTSDLALISWTYNSTAYTLSDGTTTYTVNTLISNSITGQYDKKPEIGKWLMTKIIEKSLSNSLISSAEATTLKAALG
jgi:hypothetical protein